MANDSKTWRCGKYELSFDRPRIMGVLNVTPDSFSDGGEHFDPDAAIEYGLAMLDAGADIIDVGGESTRPGFTPVNPDEEARRVLPVVRALAKEGAIVSIDTRHVAVAKAAVRCGASIVNDVTGFTDPKMVEFVKTSTCGVIVMHAGEVAAPARTHATVQLDTSAAAFVAEKAREAAAEAAREAEKPARRRRGKLLGEPKVEAKLPGGVVQPSLPFGEPEPTSEPATELGQETPAAEQAAAAETVAPAPEAAPEATEAESESNDRLAAMMRRSARREEAYVPTSQLRRPSCAASWAFCPTRPARSSMPACRATASASILARALVSRLTRISSSSARLPRWRHWAIRSCAPCRASALWAPSRA